ncbi:MAG: pentapeptide repeat-containing protein [Spirochaetia bacterium]|nr:pentapeptide repeat-containing protein [Spirochaetia bacterium]
MFRKNQCAYPGCSQPAVSGSGFCSVHDEDREQSVKTLIHHIQQEKHAINVDFSNMRLLGTDFSRIRFIGCRFSHAILSHVMFTGGSFRLCFFDHAMIDSCDFSGVDMDFCSCGNADIIDSTFENSELIHVNFTGSRIRESTFSSSNLYDSRFILSLISHTTFDNCDFKRVYFIPEEGSEAYSVNNSNFMEAIRDVEHLYL